MLNFQYLLFTILKINITLYGLVSLYYAKILLVSKVFGTVSWNWTTIFSINYTTAALLIQYKVCVILKVNWYM